MWITLLVLAIFTIGAVSATDSADSLAVDDIGDEQIIESPVNDDSDVLADPAPADFNVTITDKEVSYDTDATIVSFDWPSYVGEYDEVQVKVGDNYPIYAYKSDGETSRNITLYQLPSLEPGTYDITVLYKNDLELAKGTLKLTYGSLDFISISSDVFSNEDNVVAILDPTGASVDGVVTIFIGANQAYSKKVYSNPGEDVVIYGSELSGYYNGDYEVKVVYKTTDGKEYSTSDYTTFENIGTKEKTTISASSFSTVYNGNKNIEAVLKDSNGKPISGAIVYINFFGVPIQKTTDANGKVKLSVNGVNPGIHTAKITFDGKGKYAATSKSIKVTISKATPKLTAAKKTFKKSVATKKYAVTLKDTLGNVNKVKVTLKVNGKTYTATTSKGVATFKITNLKKKGTFKTVVKSAATSYYNAKTVNTNIIVK